MRHLCLSQVGLYGTLHTKVVCLQKLPFKCGGGDLEGVVYCKLLLVHSTADKVATSQKLI